MISTYPTSSSGTLSQRARDRRGHPPSEDSRGCQNQRYFQRERGSRKNPEWNFSEDQCNASVSYSDKTSVSDVKTRRSKCSGSVFLCNSEGSSTRDSAVPRERPHAWFHLERDSAGSSSWKNQSQEGDKKFSNRYVYESNNCGRYDLVADYFRDMPVMADKIKTPLALTKERSPKSPPPKRNTFVQGIENSRRMHPSELEKLNSQAQQEMTKRTCNKDGSPWLPSFSTVRSESDWFRRHFKTSEPIVPPRKFVPPGSKNGLNCRAPATDSNKFHPVGF